MHLCATHFTNAFDNIEADEEETTTEETPTKETTEYYGISYISS